MGVVPELVEIEEDRLVYMNNYTMNLDAELQFV
jgi:hypothetical protein